MKSMEYMAKMKCMSYMKLPAKIYRTLGIYSKRIYSGYYKFSLKRENFPEKVKVYFKKD